MATSQPLLVYMLDESMHEAHITLIGHLLPTIRHTHRVAIVTPHVDIPVSLHQLRVDFPHIEIVALDIPAHASWLFRVRAFVAFFRDMGATIVHLFAYDWPPPSAVLVALQIAQVQRILVSIDNVPNTPAHGVPQMLTRYLARIPHRIIVSTSDAKQSLITHNTVPATHIAVIPIGIDDTIYMLHSITAQPRSHYHIPNTGFLVAVCAPLEDAYGHDVLIRAMQTVWQYHPATQLLIAGDGTQHGALHDLAAHTMQPNHIHFIPTPTDIATLLASVDIVVYPARTSAMPVTLLIAMALERPVIGSAIPNVQAIIEANGNGLLARPNDPDALASTINRLINDHALRIKLSMNARPRISQRFRKDAWLHAMHDCYRMI